MNEKQINVIKCQEAHGNLCNNKIIIYSGISDIVLNTYFWGLWIYVELVGIIKPDTPKQFIYIYIYITRIDIIGWNWQEPPPGIVANVLDGNIIPTITFTFGLILLGRYEFPYPPHKYGLNSRTIVLQQEWLWH